MKNLRNYCIKVRSDRQRKIAIEFYKRATHLASSDYDYGNDNKYVGLLNNHPSPEYFKYNPLPRKVICGPVPCPNETVIPFNQIYVLADTPLRRKVLDDALAYFDDCDCVR